MRLVQRLSGRLWGLVQFGRRACVGRLQFPEHPSGSLRGLAHGAPGACGVESYCSMWTSSATPTAPSGPDLVPYEAGACASGELRHGELRPVLTPARRRSGGGPGSRVAGPTRSGRLAASPLPAQALRRRVERALAPRRDQRGLANRRPGSPGCVEPRRDHGRWLGCGGGRVASRRGSAGGRPGCSSPKREARACRPGSATPSRGRRDGACRPARIRGDLPWRFAHWLPQCVAAARGLLQRPGPRRHPDRLLQQRRLPERIPVPHHHRPLRAQPTASTRRRRRSTARRRSPPPSPRPASP